MNEPRLPIAPPPIRAVSANDRRDRPRRRRETGVERHVRDGARESRQSVGFARQRHPITTDRSRREPGLADSEKPDDPVLREAVVKQDLTARPAT